MIIDCHTHAWGAEDLAALDAVNGLLDDNLNENSPYNWSPRFRGSLECLLAEEKAAGIHRFVLLPTTRNPEKCRERTAWAAEAGTRHPEIIPFGSVHPYSKAPQDDVAFVLDQGLPGVKLHSLVQRFDPMSGDAMKLYGILEKAGLPVLMDSMFLPGAVAVKPNLGPWMEMAIQAGFQTVPGRIAEICRRFPGLSIIAAHLGCCYGWHLLDPLYELDQVYFDLAYVHRLVTPDLLMDTIRRKGADRIVFGTDAPYRRPDNALKFFMNLPLDRGEKKAILSANLLGLLKI